MTQWDRLIEPNEEDLIRAWIEHHLDQVHGPFLARVQSYDRDRGTVDVVPLIRHAVRDPDGGITHEDLPVIPCCPVAWPRAGGFFIAFALQPGDLVVCLTMTNAYGHWWAGDGSIQDPGDLRRHHIGNSIALPLSVHPRQTALQRAPRHNDSGAPRVVVGTDAADGTRLTLNNDGSLVLAQGAVEVIKVEPDNTTHIGGAAASQFVALANLVNDRLETLRSAFNAHTHVLTGTTAAAGAPLTGTASAVASPVAALATVAATKAKAT